MSHRSDDKGCMYSVQHEEDYVALSGEACGGFDTPTAVQLSNSNVIAGAQTAVPEPPLSEAGVSVGRCAVCTGCLKCKAVPSSEGAPSSRSVQDVVDAVTGATWSTRNRIMEGLFQEDLAAGATGLPAFSPPGSPVEHQT